MEALLPQSNQNMELVISQTLRGYQAFHQKKRRHTHLPSHYWGAFLGEVGTDDPCCARLM